MEILTEILYHFTLREQKFYLQKKSYDWKRKKKYFITHRGEGGGVESCKYTLKFNKE